MQFCAECNNILYPHEDLRLNQLKFRCKRCRHEEEPLSACVYTNHITTESTSAMVLINKDIVGDPTLPRSKTISCPRCSTKDAVYMTFPSKNEEESMRLIYVCCACCEMWKEDIEAQQE